MSQMSPRQARGLLGVTEGATETQIKTAYRKAAFRMHPDRAANPSAQKEATQKMQQLNAARETLLNQPTEPFFQGYRNFWTRKR